MAYVTMFPVRLISAVGATDHAYMPAQEVHTYMHKCLSGNVCCNYELPSMKVIRHAGVDSRMIILDDQARQQMTLHFQFSLQCNVSPITGFVRHTAAVCLTKPVMGETLH